MKKHLVTIIGIVLTLGIACGVLLWDSAGSEAASLQRSHMLYSACVEEKRAATGAPVSQDFPECRQHLDAHELGQSARNTSAIMAGGAAGAGFALLFFGGLWFLRRRKHDGDHQRAGR
jgi:MYXO-CTERM domain-containing protein